MDTSADILTGRTMEHLQEFRGTGLSVHREVAGPLGRLADGAAAAGFELRTVSAFRDFATQLRIWNDKATGKRPLLDARSRPLEIRRLEPREIVHAILRWSALPGASRHHWGTDIDVVDGAALPPGYQVRLVPEEVSPGGLFAPFHDWLDGEMGRYGFFRPYREDRGGVSPERWHLSFSSVASRYLKALTLDVLEETIRGADMVLKDVVLAELKDIHARYVRNVSPDISG